MQQKKTFKTVLVGITIIFMLLPLLAGINSLLTQWLNHSGWWRPVQNLIVPWQARMVAVVISVFGINSKITPGSIYSTFYMIKDGGAIPVYLSWNCLGWQSILLFFVSMAAGLRGNYTFVSRAKCIIFGLLGTLLMNIFRMSLIALGIYFVNSFAAHIIHDYLAAFLTLIWLLIFWKFSYQYILNFNESKAGF